MRRSIVDIHHSIDPILRTCGEVGAAPYMPAELFEPQNALKLLPT